jgi:hypothetical protein
VVHREDLPPMEQVYAAMRVLIVSASAEDYPAAVDAVDAFLDDFDDDAVRDVACQLAVFPRWYRRTGDYSRERLEHSLLEWQWSEP